MLAHRNDKERQTAFKKWRDSFLEGREYERKLSYHASVRNGVIKAGRELLSRFPKERKPDDGNGDEDSYNSGYNEALRDVGDIVVDAFGIKPLYSIKTNRL